MRATPFTLMLVFLVAGCVPAYTTDDPAVRKVDALAADAAEIAEVADGAAEVLANPDASADAVETAVADLQYAILLARTMGIVARSLRRDLLNEDPNEAVKPEEPAHAQLE